MGTLCDHYNEANIDSLLVEKASLANQSFVGAGTTPNLTVGIDATVVGNLFVSGTGRIIRGRCKDAPPFNNLERGVLLTRVST